MTTYTQYASATKALGTGMISEKGKAVKENTVNRKKDQEGQH